ncbi:hypothetical protein ACFU53_06465 [Streptomyces sp. NPDC057474]|uniref:hypothetical protein n=1 Tax=Streptomyces sp. NPDC057474 TaxID=3346144 RepID=UPI00369A288C
MSPTKDSHHAAGGVRLGRLDDRPDDTNRPPFNAALNSLSLVADREVANAAGDLADTVGRFALLVAGPGPKNRGDLQRIMSALASGQLPSSTPPAAPWTVPDRPSTGNREDHRPGAKIKPYTPTPRTGD